MERSKKFTLIDILTVISILLILANILLPIILYSQTEIKYSHRIGDKVTLKDGSIWYVIENSETSSDTVTLFASQNIKKDATGWTTVKGEYEIAFDEANARTTEKNSYCDNPVDGCNIYAAQSGTVTNGSLSGTVTEDSTIKKFLDESVTNYINNSLTSNGGSNINSIRLITTDDICNIINAANRNNNCTPPTSVVILPDTYKNEPDWLYSTYYWTQTPSASGSGRVYNVGISGILYDLQANDDSYCGARPVIVTLKSNIK